jgi:MoaA/NifB/PqqE/SkfB family radical SAM enzyme/quercetin dioxygenase-like cupin family protein
LEASTVCQLRCPSCPTATGEVGRELGVGFLALEDFRRFVEENPGVSAVELSNWGEIFLNKDLSKILEFAYRKNVALFADNGVNLNHLDESVAEALVQFQLRSMTCSIDGASQETYPIYRVNGDFRRVIHNIKTINRYKARYGSRYPGMDWQFVVFGHNEHEIEAARSMAADLDMGFSLKLSWEDLYTEPFSPVMDRDQVRREVGLGVASRTEFREKYGREYILRSCCAHMWSSPQVHRDGRVLGCPINHWGDYGNAFQDGLLAVVNGEKMSHARAMLMGKARERPDIPCTRCTSYQQMKASGAWLRADETRKKQPGKRWQVGLENWAARRRWTSGPYAFANSVREALGSREFYRGGPAGVAKKIGSWLNRRLLISPRPRLRSGIHSLEEPIQIQDGRGWHPRHFFRGRSRSNRQLACHMSELKPGFCPHPPHRHKEEEILMLLSGAVEIPLPDLGNGPTTETIGLEPGELVYYPSFFGHTIKAVGKKPARYLMFKWSGDGSAVAGAPTVAGMEDASGPRVKTEEGAGALSFGRFHPAQAIREMGPEDGFKAQKIFGGPTECLDYLRCHTSTLSPGAGYPAHADEYDVGIVVLEGEVETLGMKAEPGDLIFYAAGEPHGMRNSGEAPANYVVFEFHGRASARQKLANPARWRRKIRSLLPR